MLASLAILFIVSPAGADQSGGAEKVDSRTPVASGDDSPLLWERNGEVRRTTVQRFAGVASQTRVTKEGLEVLTKRRLARSGGPKEHGGSWLKLEVELDPAELKPLSPPTPMPKGLTKASSKGDSDIVLFVDTIVSAGIGEVPEPTAVAVGQYVLFTANWYYAISVDGGESFDVFDPYAGPFEPPAGAEFCCDQTSVYDPSSNTVFFLQQYFPTATTGVQRISVDQGADGSFECAYDLTPQIAGYPANRWADYPDLAISDGHLFHSSNVFDTQQQGPSVGAFVLRYPLVDIAACSANFDAENLVEDFMGLRFTRGADGTMYFASHISNDAIRIWSWPDTDMQPTFVDRSVKPWMTGTRTCVGPDGREYCAGVDNRLQSGWVADGVVGFMWVPAQGGGYPFPYTRASMFSTSGLVLVEENDINSSLFALIYPSVAVNDNEDLGGAIMIGGGEIPVTGLVWIADDLNGDSLVPLEFEVASVSGFGPVGGRTGDYTMARPYYPAGSQWIATTYGFLGDPGGGLTTQHPAFHRFGREETIEAVIFQDGFESGDTSAWSSGF